MPTRIAAPLVMLMTAAAALAGCTGNPVQLASPYNETIDTLAQSLEADFLAFATARMQASATPEGTYSHYVTSYADFGVRLSIITMRAASDPGGTTCGEAIKLASRAATNAGVTAALAATNIPPDGSQSCISLEVNALQHQFTSLQQADAERCATPGPLCQLLFPAGTAADLLPSNNSGKAPLLRATVVSLESLIGFEQDLKPLVKG